MAFALDSTEAPRAKTFKTPSLPLENRFDRIDTFQGQSSG